MHPLVEQLKFARAEFGRVFTGVTDADAQRRLLPMNSLGWIVAHLALQEQRYWVVNAQGQAALRRPELLELAGYPDQATTPELETVLELWYDVTSRANVFLDTAGDAELLARVSFDGEKMRENFGTMLLRNVHHYWFHIGEAHAIRQQLGHANLPDFVGAQGEAPFRSGWANG